MHSVYIHIPFCKTICTYCDFCKVFYNEKFTTKYLQNLEKEILSQYNNEILDTIYIGGGTPSSLNQVELKKLLDEISKITDIKGYDDEIMFTPSENKATMREDIEGEMLSAKEALANAPKKNGNFVEVPVMINE